jgi:hypothetical protein
VFDQYWTQGWRTLARRREDSLWLEPAAAADDLMT